MHLVMAKQLGEGEARRSGVVTETLTLRMGCARAHRREKNRSKGRRRERIERAFDCALSRRRRWPEHAGIGRRRRRRKRGTRRPRERVREEKERGEWFGLTERVRVDLVQPSTEDLNANSQKLLNPNQNQIMNQILNPKEES